MSTDWILLDLMIFEDGMVKQCMSNFEPCVSQLVGYLQEHFSVSCPCLIHELRM